MWLKYFFCFFNIKQVWYHNNDNQDSENYNTDDLNNDDQLLLTAIQIIAIQITINNDMSITDD